MEGIDLALLIQIFKAFKSTPAGQGGARPAFCGAEQPFFRGAGHTSLIWSNPAYILTFTLIQSPI